MTSPPVPSRTLHDFVAATAERDRPGDVFGLESVRMLEVHVKRRVRARLGAMSFAGDGLVVVQPYEEVTVAASR